ncbi:MAG TPA: PilZ domain-containing protein [Croceibacterium sp.]|nr:PilZ domain-containing protein [Croceibacterium sp.]
MTGTPLDAASRHPRKNVMLAATISSGAVSAPVRIRNLSEVGAMIDGPALPDPGAALTLNRLALSIAATVVWNRGGRCGLSLGCPIVVDDWIAGASKAPTGHGAGQFRVDQVQQAIRSGADVPAALSASPARPVHTRQIERNVAAELGRVRAMLDMVCEELSDDPEVLQRHERALQTFDIAGMILEELGAVLLADDRHAALAAVQMHELRSRLSGRLTLT